ncbi:MAG: glycoside hydrolase family 3 C-terminal domain-containing protein [Chloroflexota bacterium]
MNDIKKIISQMTLEEKASLCSGLDFWHLKGIERLGIPSIMVTDGPHGLRKQEGDPTEIGLSNSVPATCFPTASALAATWNRALIHQVGEALAEECKEEKVGVILGPGANIKRSPLCGRNFEYFSEDPYLTGEIAKNHINGVQSLGIGTSIKHYAANNQEYRRMTIDAIVDERALREIYLAGYEIAVKGAQPWTAMCAYNKVNGTYACEHPDLLRKILKDEWGHEGLVVTDWGAMNERVDGLAAGLELEMPGTNNGNDALIVAAVQDGKLEEAVLDEAAARIVRLIFKAEETLSEDFTYDRHAHHALARRVAGEGAVLLKNEANTLPLEKNTKIALIGQMAKIPRYQGAGSSLINPSQMENIHDEIEKIAGKDHILFAPGYTIKGLDVDQSLIEEAVAVSKDAEIVVICAGLPDNFEAEGLDRDHMQLPESHDQLIEAVAAVHQNIVVVLSNGSPVEMPWVNDVQAILEGYLGGQAGAGAIADILYGVVNPSGKLGETFPLALEDNPSFSNFPGGPKTVEYRESIYVGYRFFDTVNKDVLFPFGHGLSYTNYSYDDLNLSKTKITDNETLTVTLRVKNTGPVEGKEIVQLYVSPTAPTAFRPSKELKGFEKIVLQTGEDKEIKIELNRRAFAFFNTSLGDWHVESGTYHILVGTSSQDIRLQGEVQIESSQDEALVSDLDKLPAYMDFPTDAKISLADFEKLLGRSVPSNTVSKKEVYTLNTPLGDMSSTLIGRQLGNMVKKQIENLVKDDPDSATALMMRSMVKGMPLRALLMMGGDGLNRDMLEGLLLMLNGKFFKGLGALVKATRQK